MYFFKEKKCVLMKDFNFFCHNDFINFIASMFQKLPSIYYSK